MKKKSLNENKYTILIIICISAIFIVAVSVFIAILVSHGKGGDNIAIKKVAIISEPTKKEYYVGEKFDFFGLIVEYELNKTGEKVTTDWNEADYEARGFDGDKIGEQRIEIYLYGNKIYDFIIEVKQIILSVYDNVIYISEPLKIYGINRGTIIDKTFLKVYFTHDDYSQYDYFSLFTGENGETSVDSVDIAEDITLYVTFQNTSLTITFDARGGVSPISSLKMSKDAIITVLPPPTRAGYIFSGWSIAINDHSAIIKYPYRIRTDITLYAIWLNKE